jgi:transposase-like protein
MAAPVLAVGDAGALGFWAAAREVWPETGAQSCWCHKLSNVLDKLPKQLQPRAKRALHEMMYAERRSDCEAASALRGRVSGQVRERATRGAGSRTKGLLMAFKLLEMAQQR